MTHDQEVNFNERFRGKEDTAKELQNHAAKKKKTTQDTWVDAVENEEVAKIKRAVLRKIDSIVHRNDQGVQHQREQQAGSRAKIKENLAKTQTKNSTKG